MKSNLPVPQKRPLLIHNHNAKAGGGSIIQILKETKKCKIDNKKEYGFPGLQVPHLERPTEIGDWKD